MTLLAVAACSAGPVTGTGSGSTSDGVTVQVKPNHVTGWSGDTVRLHATVRDSDGKIVSGESVAWSSGDTTIATVDQSGLVTFQQLSTDTASVTISASVSTGGGNGNGHAYGSSDASNQGGKPTKVTVSPSSASVPVGSHVDLSATVVDKNGNKKGTGVSWSSSDTSLAVVSDTGVVTGRRTGTVTITADAGPASGSASIDVTPGTGSTGTGTVADVTATPSSFRFSQFGEQVQISATATDSFGNVVTDAAFQFSSTDPSVVSVDSVGTMTANALGTALVIVSAVCCSGSPTGVPVDTVTASVDTTAASALFSDDFEGFAVGSQPAGTGANGFTWKASNAQTAGGDYLAISDLITRSGSRSLRFHFAGDSDWSKDAWSEQRFSFPQTQQFWVEWYAYYPSGNEGLGLNRYEHRDTRSAGFGSDNNKLLDYWAIDYGGYPHGLFQTWSDASSAPNDWLDVARTDYTSGGHAFYPCHSSVIVCGVYGNHAPWVASDADRGRWMQVRIHVKLADYGQSNGRETVWKDGQVVLDIQNDPNYNASPSDPTWVANAYFMGWANSGFSVDTDVFVDDFSFYTQNPGW